MMAVCIMSQDAYERKDDAGGEKLLLTHERQPSSFRLATQKNKLPMDLTAGASDCIQPGGRIFVFLLLGNHKASRAAKGKVALVSAGNASILLMRTKCRAFFVVTAGIMGGLCFHVKLEEKH